METIDFFQAVFFLIALVVLSIPLGAFIGNVLRGDKHLLSRPLRFLETGIYRMSGVETAAEMTWKQYALALLLFNLVGFLFVLGLQLFQHLLPLNPAKLGPVPFWLAVNTSVSFMTNTNWQAYAGENTLSYLTQMLGLGVHNFLSAATGIAVVAALARGLVGRSTHFIGNFWIDLVRSTIYVLLPLAVLWAILLMGQGVLQNFVAYVSAQTLEGVQQILPMGPVASQIAIKQLGSNGGGFFGVNSAHPFENATPFSNFLEMFALLLIPAALPIAYGRLVGDKRHGLIIYLAMFILFIVVLVVAFKAEFAGNPALAGLNFLEGKEIRFGIVNSVLWGMASTVTSNGSVNAMLSSFSPGAGGLALLNMMLGEVVWGGVGSGLYGMALFILVTVFIAGLMVGRTPEYLGKKIEAGEIKLAVIGILAPSLLILTFSAFASISELGLASLGNKGPHGLSEILYAFTSTTQNNGSAFGGLNANTAFFNITTSITMLVGRFIVLIPVLAIAGRLASKKFTPPSSGSFPTNGGSFLILLCSTLVIVGALTFFPALCLGPIMEHFLMLAGRFF